jgi:hypothetical protein
MSGKRLSMNISGSRPAIMASKNATGTSINVRQQNDSLTPELSKAMKNVREWKSVEGENKQEYSWFVKDKQGNNGDHIYLYCAESEHVQGNYQALGLLRDICLVPATDIVYALVKQGRTYIKFRYCFKLSNYNKNECFSELCASIVDDIEKGNVSFLFLFLCRLLFLVSW